MSSNQFLVLNLPFGIDQNGATDLQKCLGRHLTLGEPRFIVQKGGDPNISAQLVELIGDAKYWAPLVAGATAFCARFGTKAADALWEKIARNSDKKEMNPLAEVSDALSKAAINLGSNAKVVVGLSVPDSTWGTVLVVEDPAPEQIIYALSLFVLNAEELSIAMKKEIADGNAPLGRAFISIEENYLIVRWTTHDNFCKKEIWISIS